MCTKYNYLILNKYSFNDRPDVCAYTHEQAESVTSYNLLYEYADTCIHYITLQYSDARVLARKRGARKEKKGVNTAAIANSFRLNWIPRRIFAKDAYFIEMAIRAHRVDDSHRHTNTKPHLFIKTPSLSIAHTSTLGVASILNNLFVHFHQTLFGYTVCAWCSAAVYSVNSQYSRLLAHRIQFEQYIQLCANSLIWIRKLICEMISNRNCQNSNSTNGLVCISFEMCPMKTDGIG